MDELRKVVSVAPLSGYRIALRFDNGVEGELDLTSMVQKGGVYTPLQDPAFFTKVYVDPEWGCVAWPNDVDLCPDALYMDVQAQRSAA
jgi:hypothetical protein